MRTIIFKFSWKNRENIKAFKLKKKKKKKKRVISGAMTINIHVCFC